MILDIVEPGKNTSNKVKALFSILYPGSAAVRIDNKIYYEGGAHIGTKEEKAVIAASRASQNYPTIARFFIPIEEIKNLKVIGTVETDNWTVRWE